jgi:periplasmic mercuric ion binding protein
VIRTFIFCVMLSAAARADDSLLVVRVGIKGMVCSFCSIGLKKTFQKQTGVKQVDVSLETKELIVKVEPGVPFTDGFITEKVSDCGFEVTSIKR